MFQGRGCAWINRTIIQIRLVVCFNLLYNHGYRATVKQAAIANVRPCDHAVNDGLWRSENGQLWTCQQEWRYASRPYAGRWCHPRHVTQPVTWPRDQPEQRPIRSVSAPHVTIRCCSEYKAPWLPTWPHVTICNQCGGYSKQIDLSIKVYKQKLHAYNSLTS